MEVMASIAVKATALVVCAFVVAAFPRRAPASFRHSVYAVSFVGLLLLPLAERFMPVTSLPLLGRAAGAQATAPVAERADPVDSSMVPVAAGSVSNTPVPSPAPTGASWSFAAVVRNAYACGVAVLIASLGAGVWRLRRWSRGANVWLRGSQIAVQAIGDAGNRRAVVVLLSDDVSVPLTFGFRRPTIVMPSTAARWSDEAIRRALDHELEHVRRNDWLLHIMARLACAFYWPHPMVWVAWRRFCLEAERACDDAVLDAAEPSLYADQLVSLARSVIRRPAVPALAMASRSALSERVHAILDPAQRRGRQSRAATIAAAAAAITIVLTFGSLRIVAAPAKDMRPEQTSRKVGDAVAYRDVAAARQSRTEDAISDAIRDGIAGALADDIVRQAVAGAFRDLDIYRDAIVSAAEQGDIEALEHLFTRSAIDINTAFAGDGTALLIAARSGRKEAVRWLLDRGADPNVPSPGDGNALIAAAGAGQTEVVQMLLDRGARIDEVVPGDENALITASGSGHADAVHLLISRGANVNARVWADDREWRSPLIMARRGRHDDVVAILRAAGAVE
jgi:beta-lactamase regulating signal transducer with metallopeptidase domain